MKSKSKILAVLSVISIMVLPLTGCGVKRGTVSNYTVGDGENVRVGIISDIQLAESIKGGNYQYELNLYYALNNFKNRGIDLLMIAGDFSNLATEYAYESFLRVYNEVFSDTEPVKLYIMGNHDYWLDSGEVATPSKMQKRFKKYFGDSPWEHKVVNGYHFIAWSPTDGSYDKSYSKNQWVKEQIELATAQDPSKPVFVMTHSHPQDTCYGSDDWGNSDITETLKAYPNVINFSGHSHYALSDERSIMQEDFTSINTGTMSYIELEQGKMNGTIPTDHNGSRSVSEEVVNAMYMTVTKDNINIERLNAVTFEKIKDDWNIALPLSKDTFTYTYQARKNSSVAPQFVEMFSYALENSKDIFDNQTKILTFTQASSNDLVHSYELVFKDSNGNIVSVSEKNIKGEEIRYNSDGKSIGVDSKGYDSASPKMINKFVYFSDFYKGVNNMSPTISLRLPLGLASGNYTIEITAIDSFDNRSNPKSINVTL